MNASTLVRWYRAATAWFAAVSKAGADSDPRPADPSTVPPDAKAVAAIELHLAVQLSASILPEDTLPADISVGPFVQAQWFDYPFYRDPMAESEESWLVPQPKWLAPMLVKGVLTDSVVVLAHPDGSFGVNTLMGMDVARTLAGLQPGDHIVSGDRGELMRLRGKELALIRDLSDTRTVMEFRESELEHHALLVATYGDDLSQIIGS